VHLAIFLLAIYLPLYRAIVFTSGWRLILGSNLRRVKRDKPHALSAPLLLWLIDFMPNSLGMGRKVKYSMWLMITIALLKWTLQRKKFLGIKVNHFLSVKK
jgi:hypothetical protein